MPRDTRDRDVELRRLLVAQATRAPRSVPWPALVGTVAVVALLGGVAIGATAFRGTGDAPVNAPDPIELPPFVSADSILVDSPTVITTSAAVAHEMGAPHGGATGLAVWVRCDEPGRFDVEIDGRAESGGDCGGSGGGSYARYAWHGPNVVRVTPSEGSATVWIAWIVRGNDIGPSAQAEAALADGIVTREEYQAGFDRLADCLSDWGVDIGEGSWVGDAILYSLPGDDRAAGAIHECYRSEFQGIDATWQVSQEE